MSSMKDMTIGQRVAALRKQAGMSQENLADKLKISRQAVSRWESDASLPDIDKLIVLSDIFSVSLEMLLGIPSKETTAFVNSDTTSQSLLVEYRMQEKRLSRRAFLTGVISAFAASLLFAAVFSNLMNTRNDEIIEQINSLNSTVAGLQGGLNDVPSMIEEKINMASWEENRLVVSYTMKVKEADYTNNRIVIAFDGISVNKPDTLSFYSVNKDLSATYAGVVNTDPTTGRIHGEVTVPYEDDLSYCMSINGETCALRKGDDIVYHLVKYTTPEFSWDGYGWDGTNYTGFLTGHFYMAYQPQEDLNENEITMYYDLDINGKPLNNKKAVYDCKIGEQDHENMPRYIMEFPCASSDEELTVRFSIRVEFSDGRHIEYDPKIVLHVNPKAGTIFAEEL